MLSGSNFSGIASASDPILDSAPTQVHGFIDGMPSAVQWEMKSPEFVSEAKNMEAKTFDPNEIDSHWTWTSRSSKQSRAVVSISEAVCEVQQLF